MYLSALKLPLIRTTVACVVYPITLQNVTQCARLLYWYRLQASNEWSPRTLQTRICSSEYCMQNRESSEKTTFYHSCIKLSRSMRQSRQPSPSMDYQWGVAVLITVSIVHAVANAVRKDIGRAANKLSYWLMKLDVIIRFSKADLKICLVVSDVSNGRTLRSCMSFTITLRNSLNLIRIMDFD